LQPPPGSDFHLIRTLIGPDLPAPGSRPLLPDITSLPRIIQQIRSLVQLRPLIRQQRSDRLSSSPKAGSRSDSTSAPAIAPSKGLLQHGLPRSAGRCQNRGCTPGPSGGGLPAVKRREGQFRVAVHVRLAQAGNQLLRVQAVQALLSQGWTGAETDQPLQAMAGPGGDHHRRVHRPAAGVVRGIEGVARGAVQVRCPGHCERTPPGSPAHNRRSSPGRSHGPGLCSAGSRQGCLDAAGDAGSKITRVEVVSQEGIEVLADGPVHQVAGGRRGGSPPWPAWAIAVLVAAGGKGSPAAESPWGAGSGQRNVALSVHQEPQGGRWSTIPDQHDLIHQSGKDGGQAIPRLFPEHGF